LLLTAVSNAHRRSGKLLISAWHGESSPCVTQTTQRKEESTEESTRNEESKSWYWQKGTVKHRFVIQSAVIT